MIDNMLCKYKDIIFCVQVKSKPCVVNIIMHLISWKRSCGSESNCLKDVLPALSPNQNYMVNYIRGHCTMYYLPK
jgi:hypothetical protein